VNRTKRIALAVVPLSLFLVLLSIAPAGAGDERPEAIVYDTPGPIPSLSLEALEPADHPVVIEDQTLKPHSVVMWQGESIAWTSASRSASRIVFEREVARSLVCHSLVNFHLAEDELRSGDLYAGDQASFCELAPGHYRYHVVRPGHSDPQGMAGARRLDGWIVVRARPLADAAR